MKPETEEALRARTKEQMQEIVRLMADELDAEDFVAALCDDGDLTGDGDEIFEYLATEFGLSSEQILTEDMADRLHEAICEGRRQDAVDLLNEITGRHHRTVEAQENLFPHRAPGDIVSRLNDF